MQAVGQHIIKLQVPLRVCWSGLLLQNLLLLLLLTLLYCVAHCSLPRSASARVLCSSHAGLHDNLCQALPSRILLPRWPATSSIPALQPCLDKPWGGHHCRLPWWHVDTGHWLNIGWWLWWVACLVYTWFPHTRTLPAGICVNQPVSL